MAHVALTFKRTSVHLVHDIARLEEGEDLNDALMDFFVKLGQALIPCGGADGGGEQPSVAYLGSLFYDVLRKGGVKDGGAGHANVANWAKRRLGKKGLFDDGIGALAVPVNEMLKDDNGKDEGKHWWLALILNPSGGVHAFNSSKKKPESKLQREEHVSLLCLDSLAAAETMPQPPMQASRDPKSKGCCSELAKLGRAGPLALVQFRARAATPGSLGDPGKSVLWAEGDVYTDPEVELVVDQPPKLLQGYLQFTLKSAVKTCGMYTFEYGGSCLYKPPLSISLQRESTAFQTETAQFLGGYLAKEWDSSTEAGGKRKDAYVQRRVEDGLRLPDVPQQENSNDCGYFILEQILRALQLAPAVLRGLAKMSDIEIAALPWPTQEEVSHRKAKLRECLGTLFSAAGRAGTSDVEVLLAQDVELRKQIQAALWEGPAFAEAVGHIIGMPLPAHPASQEGCTLEDLERLPSITLRSLCIQYGVLSHGRIDRMDLLQALAPFIQSVRICTAWEGFYSVDVSGLPAGRGVKRMRMS